MEMLSIRVLRGPNYWSNYRKKLIVIKLDLQEFEKTPTNKIEGFNENLKRLLPSLYTHRCSCGYEGGFFERIEEGTWLGHVIEHVALELQCLAGIDCGYGRTRSTSKEGIYHVVFSYITEGAGIYAGTAAIKLIKTLAKKKPYTELAHDIEELKRLYQAERLGPSTESLVKEAERRGIPWCRLDHHSLIMLGQGCHQKLICSTVSSHTSCLGVDLVANKQSTKNVLAAGHICVPTGKLISSLSDLDKAIEELGFPLVIKPEGGNHGKGITTQIINKEKAIFAYKMAKRFSKFVLIEHHIHGSDYRLLIINYKLVAAAKRTPALIVGNGQATIQVLIDEANAHPDRGDGHQNFLTKIKIDELTQAILAEQGFTLNSVLSKGQVLYLKNTANISSGGTAVDVTHLVHPKNVFLAERIARLVNLDICGIDLIAEDIRIPITEENGAIIEVNAAPGFRMHLCPTKGQKRNVAKPVIDMLYPAGVSSRIPLVAVTGTNGKTTIVRLIAHLAKMAGYSVGCTTTDGVYIQNQPIYQGDCSGPLSASVILRDPIVNFGVLECARGGILRSGLGFDQCNISIVSNISEDHLGIDDIDTLEQLARVKSVVPRSTMKEGYAILNADDNLVFGMKQDLNCQVALFSMQASNERIAMHCEQGGLASFLDNGIIIIQQGHEKIQVANIADIPLTYSGFAQCMIKNILPAVLAAFISRFPVEKIAAWLSSFDNFADNIPGRMNLFNFDHFQVLIDYAHNEQAFIELKHFIDQIDSVRKVGIIAATGDRRPIDIKKVGFYAAQTFDEIIIRQDRDSRDRSHQELTELMLTGIKQSKQPVSIKIIPNEFDAIKYAMDNAEPNTFIMYFPDEILKAVDYMKQAKLQLQHSLIKGNISP